MEAEPRACPRCGECVDEVDGEQRPVPVLVNHAGPGGTWRYDEAFAYCPHCGTVLAVLPALP